MDRFGSPRHCPYSPARPSGSAASFLPKMSTKRNGCMCYSRNQAPPAAFNELPHRKSWSSDQKKSPGTIQMPPLKQRLVTMCQITPEDWQKANSVNYQRLENNRRHAESFRRNTLVLIQNKEQLTRRTQADSSRWLGERITDISYWKSELSFELEQLLKDTEALQQIKLRLDKAITETEMPLQMSRECLWQRQRRIGSDRVNDVVEKELVQEVTVIRSCQEQLERVRDKVKKQLESNRSVQHQLESDLSDKSMAFQIDSHCHTLSNSSTTANFDPNLDRLDTSVSLPSTWRQFSQDNIGLSVSERKATQEVIEEVEHTLVVAARDMWSQYNHVNVAFTNHISQTQYAKNTLQQHLSKTLQEMEQTERTIAELEESIREKRAPLHVAQIRLEERTRRPNMELCNDPPHTMLLAEVGHIRETVMSLHQRLCEAQATLQQLADCKYLLEEELFTKSQSLHIDQERCLGLRKTYPSSPRLIGYA
ncbi:tektin-3-like [Aplochiton taeniatus]